MTNQVVLRCIIFVLGYFLFSTVSAQTNKTFFLGHSLINFEVPNMVDKLSIASNETFSYDANIGNGATLLWHWENPTTGQGDQWDLTLPLGGYEKFILTEAVPLENHLQYSDTYKIADSLYTFAKEFNPDIQYYIYETWHCTNSGNGSTSGSGGYPCSWDPNSNELWRDRIDIDLPRWESIADSINLNHDNPMLVIPGGQALGRLADHIEDGEVPGLNSILDLFGDEYHLDSRGNYFIACVMFSVIHGMSPEGLPNQLTNQYDNLYTIYPTSEQATIFQEIAWQTVCDYQRDGVECGPVAVSSSLEEKPKINIYPVPASEFITIECEDCKGNVPYIIYDQLGQIIKNGTFSSRGSTVNIADLTSGIYFLTANNKTAKFIK